MKTKERLKAEILKKIRNYSQRNMPITQLLDIPGMRGDQSLCPTQLKNAFFLNKVSQNAIDAVKELLQETKVDFTYNEDSLLCYLIDGAATYDYPAPKDLPKNLEQGYSKTHWIPVLVGLAEVAQ